MGNAVRCVNTSPENATTRGLNTVSSGGSPTEESPHTSIDVSSYSPRQGCVMTPTGEKDLVVDEDDSAVSDDMSDMGEECHLRVATTPDVSLSEGVAVQQNPSQEGRRNSPGPYRCVCERERETRLALSCKCVQFHIVRISPLIFIGCSVQCRR